MDKSKVAAYFDVELDAVIGSRLVDEGANVRALINYGTGGIKVYILPVSEFLVATPAKPEPQEPEPALDLESLTYKELQEMAREKGMSVNQSRQKLTAALA